MKGDGERSGGAGKGRNGGGKKEGDPAVRMNEKFYQKAGEKYAECAVKGDEYFREKGFYGLFKIPCRKGHDEKDGS